MLNAWLHVRVINFRIYIYKSEASVRLSVPRSQPALKAKFHYASLFGASSELAPNMFGASSELASVMEFGFNPLPSDRLRCCDRYIRCQRSLAIKPLNSRPAMSGSPSHRGSVRRVSRCRLWLACAALLRLTPQTTITRSAIVACYIYYYFFALRCISPEG